MATLDCRQPITVLSSHGSFAIVGREASCVFVLFAAVLAVPGRSYHVITENALGASLNPELAM